MASLSEDGSRARAGEIIRSTLPPLQTKMNTGSLIACRRQRACEKVRAPVFVFEFNCCADYDACDACLIMLILLIMLKFYVPHFEAHPGLQCGGKWLAEKRGHELQV
jgi:hypothetical protein